MSRVLHVRQAGPGVTVQDLGRPGYLAAGLSRGGAVDRLALHEGAALLGQDPGCAALEMAATGGRFEAGAPLRVALTGARMRARIDGAAVAWNASHRLEAGAVLEIGPAEAGLTVTLQAERPETLEMLRRHIDQLGADLRAQGFGTVTFEFGAPPGRGQDRGPHPGPAHNTSSTDPAALEEATMPAVARASPSAGPGTLDLRL